MSIKNTLSENILAVKHLHIEKHYFTKQKHLFIFK